MQLCAYRPSGRIDGTAHTIMALPYAIMTALLDGEQSGYDLAKQFQVSLGFFWNASHQQIYRALKDMSVDGWVSVIEVAQTGKPDKRLYRLTADGEAALEHWVLSAEERQTGQRDALFVKLYNLNASNRAGLTEAVRQRAEEHSARLALYERIRSRHYAQPERLRGRRRGVYLALLAGIHKEEAGRRWADAAIDYLSG